MHLPITLLSKSMDILSLTRTYKMADVHNAKRYSKRRVYIDAVISSIFSFTISEYHYPFFLIVKQQILRHK